MKKCSQCQRVKPLNEFAKKDKGKIGAICKSCAAEKMKQWYGENKDVIALRRSIKTYNRTLNVLRRKAKDAGFELRITFDGKFVVSLEEIKE